MGLAIVRADRMPAEHWRMNFHSMVARRFQLPSLAGRHNWLIFAVICPELREAAKQYATGKLLDIGCGMKPFRHLFESQVQDHVGVDLERREDWRGQGADHLAPADDLPFPDDAFDTVLCTDVLEHLPEPKAALREAHRVLRPGGHAIYTVPLFWHVHEAPRDYFRYTDFGLRHLYEEVGFEVVEIRPLTGFISTFGQELVYYLYSLRRGGRRNPIWWVAPPLGDLIQALALFANRWDRSTDFTAEYLAVVKKPSA